MTGKLQKKRFFDVCMEHGLNTQGLENLAYVAQVQPDIVESMFLQIAVRQEDAEKVLQTFNKYMRVSYTLENTLIAIMPTFKEICERHLLDLATLVTEDVPMAILDMMTLNQEPVAKSDASLVLQTVSMRTRQSYTLDNVDLLTRNT
jgi:hypothetical protein